MIVRIKKSATKDIQNISEPFKTQIKNKVQQLSFYPDIPNVKKLTNHNPPFRLRVGTYRILFDITDNILIISRIKHRKEAY
jgi:mRNA interferase RelE/StbE